MSTHFPHRRSTNVFSSELASHQGPRFKDVSHGHVHGMAVLDGSWVPRMFRTGMAKASDSAVMLMMFGKTATAVESKAVISAGGAATRGGPRGRLEVIRRR